MLNVRAYLDRIEYTGSLEPSRETLRDLHRAHMFHIPFENLDIALGNKIICDEGAFIRKIVERGRGGFCYELNSAFAALLRALGFRVTLLSARVSRPDGTWSPEFDHLALRVDLAEPWLADVGFGDSFAEPLQLETAAEQPQDGRRFRLSHPDGSFHLEKADSDGAWKKQYSFTLIPRSLSDFGAMCLYHQTSPDSHFTQNRICTKATRGGRITLAERKVILTRSGKKQETAIASEGEWRAALKEHFGIVLEKA
jgi:N-hydroxyarylamine O-acetyltransferase